MNHVKKRVLGGLSACILVCSLAALPANAAVSSGAKGEEAWQLVFSDEFDGDAVNTQNWNRFPAAIDSEDYFFYGSTPETVVCPENVYVKDGSLHILAENNPIDLGDGVDHKYRTGILQSRNKVELSYGRFEARIKMPDLPGSNPAFWLCARHGTNLAGESPATGIYRQV